ncbi:uncharacterized protein KGF55_004981 [Candida pseudojiufengensis]|uniref:uncharacterized protein n=1 Tax=Candida pseudojiufengensis TaxID=497109 RepID=UPI0022247FD7|nr:uncharacterized protein KGF55_004981 [Candida pseudojiufengensis]KAI5959749.1 hypothetical protein KGF55_004981 [Candida pseudojiufengensis]
MQFEEREDKDGIRLSWSSIPRSKIQHQRNVVPLASLYTPLNDKSKVELFDSSCLITCRTCRSILNPFVHVNNQIWTCQFCSYSNQLTTITNEEGETILPVALNPQFTTIEYETGRISQLPPIFFFVVDVCFEGEDVEVAFSQLKENLIISLSLLPEDALVGFVSFGKHVKLYDLTSHDNLSYTFNGSKTYTLEQIQEALGLLGGGLNTAGPQKNQGQNNILSHSARRFLQPVNMVEYELINIIENLVPNAFLHDNFKERLDRATGSAINVATLLLKSIFGEGHITGGHLMVFLSGVCTIGPGKIVDKLLKTPLRSHHEIVKSQSYIKAPITSSASNTKSDIALFKSAKKFYGELTKTLISLGLSCDIFIGSYDQVGFFEMEDLCSKTGGVVIMSDSFSTSIFKQSFTKFFKKQDIEEGSEEYLDMAFNASLEVKTSSDLKVEGLIGNATALPLNKSIPSNERMISATKEIGESKTNCWKLCSVDPQSTYAIYFEKLDSSLSSNSAFIQYLFHYQHPDGKMRLRVTTVPINVIPDSDNVQLESGFDQEAALVLIAREAMRKVQTDSHLKFISSEAIIKQLDQTLIEFCTRFAVYNIGVMESFRLSISYSLFPQFLYHLRRSPFINVFNSSPDETSYVRHIFMHEDLANSLLMIQPTLLSYDINTWNSDLDESDPDGNTINEPEPVLLDSMSLGRSKILLLDTFFQILIYHGSQIAEWRKAEYHEQKEYEYFKTFLEAPKAEAISLLMNRFPLPRFIDCDEGGSQARFLMAKLNPSTSYATNVNHFYGIGDRSDVFTDDISLQSFMDHIQRVVTSKK